MINFDLHQDMLLGEGLWGRVYDLGDGTVLKVARESSRGIGNGREKIEKEYQALSSLASTTELQEFLPKVLEKGDIPENARLAAEGFDVWMKMTKVNGHKLNITSAGNDKAAESIGRVLAVLHRAMKPLVAKKTDSKNMYAEIRKDVAGSEFYLDCITKLEEETEQIQEVIMSNVVHGDYNISNLLFSGDTVCGILDFAEWGYSYPEKDISDILNEYPSLTAGLILSYEKESGFKTDPRRLKLGIATNALYCAVISERKHDAQGIKWGRELLTAQLDSLGYKT